MIVIAARPSMGKTSLAMNIAEHVAVDEMPVGVFSLEMTAALVLRMLCSRARGEPAGNPRWISGGARFSEADRGGLARRALFIDDTAGLSILQMRAKARRIISARMSFS